MTVVTAGQIEKLHVRDGDILIVRLSADTTAEEQRVVLPDVARIVRQVTGIADFPIIVCLGDSSLETLTSRHLRELGWVRADEAGGEA